MKKHVLVISLLSVSLASNCMEQQLTVRAQERIAQEPKVAFSFTNEQIQEMRTILTKKNRIESKKIELSNKLHNETLKIEHGVIRAKINAYEEKYKLADKKLDLFLITTEDSDKYNQLEKHFFDKGWFCLNPKIDPETLRRAKAIVNHAESTCRKLEEIQQFAKNKLKENEADELFITIEKRCQEKINGFTIATNNIKEKIEK